MEASKQKQDFCLANTKSEKPVYISDSESSSDSNNYQDEDFSSASEESKDEVWEEFKEIAEQASGLIENFNRAKTISTMPLKASCPNSMLKEGGLNTPTYHGSNNSLAIVSPNKPSHSTPARKPRRSTVSVDFAREVFEPSYRLLNERTQAARLPDPAKIDNFASEIDVCEASTADKSFDNVRNHSCSPRKTLTHTTPSVFLVPSPKNIKEVQVYAQKISLRREQESQRSAQELQRQINEIETRLIDASEVGSELESKLRNDTQNTWLLENWRLYAQEFSLLQTRERELNKKIQEAHTVNEYKRLKLELSRLQQGENDRYADIGHNPEEERRIMKKLIEILDEHNQIKADLEELKTAKTHILYKDFEPVFIKD
uniref:BMERB domain-containing protein n=1 Tax=Ditylenchus dipsaci TaxID=166011 RepID=A0A915DTJ9_9BILA